ncbi:uncharacterized protein BcabD6B2_25080 [Babesia caballi]|uniref:Uncharacterized protein n=1 Tax=Babesia caballi TaxID=5871 RepID=A0AAV4LSF5_BABCB|nr:hypothetical protein BcabD6B2_25080 [Babesia caballi]
MQPVLQPELGDEGVQRLGQLHGGVAVPHEAHRAFLLENVVQQQHAVERRRRRRRLREGRLQPSNQQLVHGHPALRVVPPADFAHQQGDVLAEQPSGLGQVRLEHGEQPAFEVFQCRVRVVGGYAASRAGS